MDIAEIIFSAVDV